MTPDCKCPHHLRDVPLRSVQGRSRRTSFGVGFSGRDALPVAAARPFHFLPPSNMESSTTKTVKPVETFRLRGISASVFRNKSEDGTSFHKVSLQRTYRQGDEFKNTQSLGRDDLPIAAMLLQKAWEYVLQAEGKKSADNAAD